MDELAWGTVTSQGKFDVSNERQAIQRRILSLLNDRSAIDLVESSATKLRRASLFGVISLRSRDMAAQGFGYDGRPNGSFDETLFATRD
jgi:hypothetical protein